MQVDGVPYRSIWINADGWSIDVIDQTRLPHNLEILNLTTLNDACDAIRDMVVRGAPLIGATAAYGFYLAMREDSSDAGMEIAYTRLAQTRPTAVNLCWALQRLHNCLSTVDPGARTDNAFIEAARISTEDIETNQAIGQQGLEIISNIATTKPPGEAVNILTHCNAGWLATVDWGTATAPIYMAHNAGIPLHVWVDETRPRNQGASLTTWELGHHGVPHSLIVDNLGGHLMQHGMVDLCLVGSDRTAGNGDVCNKVGTYLKALAANDNEIPFYVCLPSTTIDWSIADGVDEIPIEQRDTSEVTEISGKLANGEIASVRLTPETTNATNYAFDVTPSRLVTGLITERAIVAATKADIARAFPDHNAQD